MNVESDWVKIEGYRNAVYFRNQRDNEALKELHSIHDDDTEKRVAADMFISQATPKETDPVMEAIMADKQLSEAAEQTRPYMLNKGLYCL